MRVAISSGPIELGRDETALQVLFSRVSTSWVVTARSVDMVFALGESPQRVDDRRLRFGRSALGWPRSNRDDQRDTSERHGRFSA